MKTVNIGILGLGTVGGGTYKILDMNRELIEKRIGRSVKVTTVLLRNPDLDRYFLINTGENILSIEETILLQYLSFIGFDIVMFVPTGYSVIEKYFIKKLFTEYELGEYMFNLKIDIKKKKGFFF